MADENNNQKNQKTERGPKRPFYMVEPESGLLKSNADGSYDVTVQIGLLNPQDKNTYPVVRFVNGKQLPGVVQLSKADSVSLFEKIKPAQNGDIRVGMALVSNQDEQSGVSLVIERNRLTPKTAASKVGSNRILVEVSYPDSEFVHLVNIRLFDEQGQPETGKITVMAGQSFNMNDDHVNGQHELEIPNHGLVVKIQPLERKEQFWFRVEATGEVVKHLLLGPKK